jgi:uncharacterized protein YbjT (DUF2867 family)
MLKHLLFDLVGHASGLSEAQLEQIERSLPATKALIELLDKARPFIEQAEKLYVEAQPLLEEARQEWQTVGPAAQILLDVVTHHLSKGRSPAEATETVRAALSETIQGGAIETVAQTSGMNRVTVFGGTGFVGRRIVRQLGATAKVRIASRHPAPAEDDGIERVLADIHDERAVEAAVDGADGIVNAISLYTEHGSDTFHSLHVEAAANIARVARRAAVKRFVHLSGIGADPASSSPYIRSRGEGEAAVQAAFPGAVIVRPAVMFAADDAFLTTILRLLRTLPAYPLFGNGRTRLQPVFVDDVAAAIAQILRQPQRPYPVYELAGPRVYAYEELLRSIARIAGLRPVLVKTPFALWGAAAGLAEILPHPPLTRNQVELMQIDTVASASLPGLGQLKISARGLEDELKTMLARTNAKTQDARESRAN